MAIALAREGGLGVIHQFSTIEEQVTEIKKVKRSTSYVIENPISVPPITTIADAAQKMKEEEVTSLLVVDSGKLVGIFTSRDYLFETDLAKKISCFLKLAYDSSAFIYAINFEILRQEYLNLGDSLKLHIEDKKIIFNLNPVSNGHSSDSNGHLPDYNGHKKQKDNVEQSQQIEQIEQTGQPQQPIVLKERKRKILSLLDKNEWRNIRDICHSLPGLATKSVQRDLLEMVGAGILKKEGNKRWRKYSVVG